MTDASPFSLSSFQRAAGDQQNTRFLRSLLGFSPIQFSLTELKCERMIERNDSQYEQS